MHQVHHEYMCRSPQSIAMQSTAAQVNCSVAIAVAEVGTVAVAVAWGRCSRDYGRGRNMGLQL
jgi:hypothetical protein